MVVIIYINITVSIAAYLTICDYPI